MHILEKQTFPVINRKVKEIFLNYRWCNEGFPGDSIDKEPTCQCRRRKRHRFNPWVRKIPWRRKWHPSQYSCWENLMDRGAWPATVQRVAKSWTQLSEHTPSVSLINVLQFSVYESSTSLMRFIPKYFILETVILKVTFFFLNIPFLIFHCLCEEMQPISVY